MSTEAETEDNKPVEAVNDNTSTETDGSNRYLMILGAVVFILASLALYQKVSSTLSAHRNLSQTKAFMIRFAGLSSSPFSSSSSSAISKVELQALHAKRSTAVKNIYELARCATARRYCETAEQSFLVSRLQSTKILLPYGSNADKVAYKSVSVPYNKLASIYNSELDGLGAQAQGAKIPVNLQDIAPPADPYYYGLFVVLVKMAKLPLDSNGYLPVLDQPSLQSAFTSLLTIMAAYHKHITNYEDLYLIQPQLIQFVKVDKFHLKIFRENQRLVQSVVYPVYLNWDENGRVLVQLATEAFSAYSLQQPTSGLFH